LATAPAVAADRFGRRCVTQLRGEAAAIAGVGAATRDATVTSDRENKTRARQVGWAGPEGPQGGTATRDVVATGNAESGTRT
jgi:hypothetical protein